MAIIPSSRAVRSLNGDRLRHVLDRLAANAEQPRVSVGDAICVTAVEVVAVDGAGITIHGPDRTPYTLGSAGEDMTRIHELERTLGEGPCIDAFRTGVPTADPDLDAAGGDSWPAFRSEVLRTRVRACFGYPLQRADDRFGALNLYSTRAGPLDEAQHRDALLIAELSTHAILAGLGSDPSASPSAIELDDVARNQDKVYQATGMVTVQLRISIVDALARLRAHAFAENRTVSEVASDVVDGRLRLQE